MKNSIYHSEERIVSRTTKQWIFSIVLLMDIIGYSLLYSYYNNIITNNEHLDKEGIIAISVIILIVSILVFIIVSIVGYTFSIDENGIDLKAKTGEKKYISNSEILTYRSISKKEANKILNGLNSLNKKHRKKQRLKQFVIGTPNYLIELKSGEKVLIQTKRNSSFEYAMNKMLNLSYV